MLINDNPKIIIITINIINIICFKIFSKITLGLALLKPLKIAINIRIRAENGIDIEKIFNGIDKSLI